MGINNRSRSRLANKTDPMKYQILEGDSIQIKHPISGLPVKLFRIIALKDFFCRSGASLNNHIGGVFAVVEGMIGGYIQSERNLPQNDDSWVGENARVFDTVTLKNSIIIGDSKVFGNSNIEDSFIFDRVRVFGQTQLKSCTLCDNVDVYDFAKLENSIIKNASVVCGKSTIIDSKLSGGSRVCDSFVKNSTLSDQSEVRKNSKVEGCQFSGRTVISNGTVLNETRSETIQLNVTTG